jgi:acetolactate synthase-1/2/3 large subunit
MGSQATNRVADQVASVIRDAGTDLAFGHPGGEVVTLIDALRNAGIRFILTRHEASAAFAAGGYAELTGRPGVCVATLGPGATNLVSGVASALLERAAIIAFTGSLAESAPAGTTHQNLKLQDLFSPVTKGTWYLAGDGAGDVTRAAVRTALAEKPGPVHLALAADVAARPASGGTPGAAPTAEAPEADPPAAPAEAVMAKARRLLTSAQRPAIVTGLTAARLGLASEVRAFAESVGAPVALTPKSKGVVPEDHSLFLGVLDMAGDRLIGEFLDRADLIVAVGCDVVELDRRWSWAAPVIHVDVVPNAEGYYTSEVELVGEVPRLLAALGDGAAPNASGPDEATRLRSAVSDYVRPASNRMQPWQVVEAVQTHASPGALATCDVGAHKILVGQLWQTRQPREFFMSNGLSTMGYSIPTALAAHLVDRDRRVIAFVGDGGIGMYLGELETLVRVGARLTIVVFADRSLELIRRAEIRREVATESTTFGNPDFAAIGRAFGIEASEVTSIKELDDALGRADAGDGIHLIAAHIDGADYRL